MMILKVTSIMKRAILMLILCSTLLIACNATPAATNTPTAFFVTATTAPNPTGTPVAARKGGAADHVLGIDSAYVTIVMYGDFQCVPCTDLARSLVVLQNRYPDDVRIMWRHFPQKENDKATLAAEASEAASAQGKFWEMHDQLLAHKPEWIQMKPD